MRNARGLLFLLLFGAGMVAHVLSSSARDSGAITARLRPDVVKTAALDAIVFELQRDRLIRSLEGGLFEMSENETRGVLDRAYSPEEMTRKLRRVHRDLIHYIDSPDSLFFVVSFAEEKPVLLDSLMVFWRRRIVSLPDCDPLQDASIGLNAVLKGVGLKSDEGFAKALPKCRPPRAIETKLLDGLQDGIAERKHSGPSSVSAFPKRGKPSYARFQRSMVAARFFGATGTFFFLAVLIGGACVYLFASLEGRVERARFFSFGLIAVGALLGGLGLWMRTRGETLDLWPIFFHAPRETLSDSTRYWFTLVIYVVKDVIEVAASRAFVFSAVCFGVAAVLRRIPSSAE